MTFNWIDIVIVAIAGLALYQGYRSGLIALLANFLSFLGSLWFAVRFHTVVGEFFSSKFGVPFTWSSVLGYLVVAIVSQLILESVCIFFLSRLPKKFFASRYNNILGSIASFIDALVVTAFFLLLTLALPLRGTIKADIRGSTIGSTLVRYADVYGGQVRSSLETIAANATKFLTVEPGSKESIPVDVPANLTTLSVSADDEAAMVVLVNHERISRGIGELVVDARLTKVAEDKSRDMFVRRYFSHVDPDGKNAGDHLRAAGIDYMIAGENLAYAPDLSSAHQGLMNSPGHRENLLDVKFHHVGIGVIDGGIYGKMFTQEFTD